MAEGFITIVNWEKFQQYKDRRPTWIKAYVGLLDHYEFSQLPDESKAHLLSLWLLAAATGNKIPNDPEWIARKINATATIDFSGLKSLGFIQYESLEPSVRMIESKCSLEKRREEEIREEKNPTYLLPPADRAEREIRLSTDALRTKLYGLVNEATAVDPKGRDATELMRLFTGYRKPDGTDIRGVVNAYLLSHERLEKSIADAEGQIEEWRQKRGA